MRSTFVKVVNEELSSDAKNIKTPAFLLWGALDTETPPLMGQELHALIQGSKYLELPDVGHNMFMNGGADACAVHILPFVTARQSLQDK